MTSEKTKQDITMVTVRRSSMGPAAVDAAGPFQFGISIRTVLTTVRTIVAQASLRTVIRLMPESFY
jgi:hypothetical protein